MSDLRQTLEKAQQDAKVVWPMSGVEAYNILQEAIHEALTQLEALERDRAKFDDMVAESHEHWGLWSTAMMAAMNTPSSFRGFLESIRKGTALDWWKTDFKDGLKDGSIRPVGAVLGREQDDG